MKKHIVQTEEALGGKARIEETRVSVEQIYEMHIERDLSPEEIAEILPSVSVEQVKQAIEYSQEENHEADIPI